MLKFSSYNFPFIDYIVSSTKVYNRYNDNKENYFLNNNFNSLINKNENSDVNNINSSGKKSKKNWMKLIIMMIYKKIIILVVYANVKKSNV